MSKWGLALFDVFIGKPDEEAECITSTFTDDTKLGEVADRQAGCVDIPRYLDELENSSERHLMKMNKGKCKMLYLGRNNARHHYILEANWLENSSAKKDLKTLLDNKLPVSQQCNLMAKVANSLLGCISKHTESMWREVIFTQHW